MSSAFPEVDRCECGHNKRKHTAAGCPYCGYAVCDRTYESEVDRMPVIAHWEPSKAMIEAVVGHIEAARRTKIHASHHARAALIDAYYADEQLRGAVEDAGRLREAIHVARDALLNDDPAHAEYVLRDALNQPGRQ